MKWRWVLPLLGVACAAPPSVETTSRDITGGYEPGPELFGVGLDIRELDLPGRFGYSTCSGTLIAPDVVLTADHCYDRSDILRSAFFTQPQVTVGTTRDYNTQLAEPVAGGASGFVRHPDESGVDFDFALVFLEAPLAGLPIARFPRTEELNRLRPDAAGLQVGYGRTIDSVPDEDRLPADPIRSRRAVEVIIDSVNASRFLTSNDTDETSCNGDSGGPIFLRVDGELVLFGVHYGGPRSEGCSGVGIANRPDAVIGWIASEMAKACNRRIRSVEGCDAQRLPIGAPSPTVPVGEAVPTIDTAPIDAGDGPPDGGCRTAGGRHDLAFVLWVVALGWLAGRRRETAHRHTSHQRRC